MKTNLKLVLGTLILPMMLGSCESDDLEVPKNPQSPILFYSNDEVVNWNTTIAFIDDKMPPPAEAKIYAMVTLAMHDALNNVVPIYDTYVLDNSSVNAKDITKDNVSQIADAAVAQSAHDVLIAMFPLSIENADKQLSTTLANIPNAAYKQKGIAIGQNAAAAVLAKRQNDPPVGFSAYTESPATGIHQSNYMPWMNPNPPVWPANAVYGANLSQLAPFGIETSDQFRARPPYAINSAEYLADYEEVRLQGCKTCPDRTQNHTDLGSFWIENLSSSICRLANLLATQDKLNGWETARLSALLQIALIDANISSFEGKYYYKYWRPITAIRAGDSDGNNETIGDAAWINGYTTPPTPDYPSTHAQTSAAAAEVLKLFFGTDDRNFTLNSPYYLPNVDKVMTSFSQIAQEAAESRIYIGFHFRNAVEQGIVEGRKLGKYVIENNLMKLTPGN